VTLPRQILPGRFYLISRRCTQRQFLLRPSTLTNQIVEYCLAVAAEQTNVQLHAVCAMSNHWHAVVFDPDARLPAFLEVAHKLIAKCQNAALGRWENFWSSDKPSVVLLVSEHDVLDKMAYVIANPTQAGLVRAPQLWPGVITHHLGERRVVERPDHFFREDGTLPDELALEFVRPPIFLGLSDATVNRMLADAVAARVRHARQALGEQGRKFLGVEGVLRQSFNQRPVTPEPRGNINPRIAARTRSLRQRAIADFKRFVRAYRHAWEAWRAGNAAQLFPAGTYALRLLAGVRCAPVAPG